MRANINNAVHHYNFNQDYLKLLAKYQDNNPQIKFILEAFGYQEEKEKQEDEQAIKYLKFIFRKVG